MNFDRITINPEVCSGKPTIRGLRFPVSQIIDLVAAGNTFEQILNDFPYLEMEDIRQALAYASALAKGTEIRAAFSKGHSMARSKFADLRISYDNTSDVLYISFGEPQFGIDEEIDNGIYFIETKN